MNATTTHSPTPFTQNNSSHIHALMDKYEQMIQRYWDENPDLYRIVKLNKQKAAANDPPQKTSSDHAPDMTGVTTVAKTDPMPMQTLRGAELRTKIRESHHEIRQRTSR